MRNYIKFFRVLEVFQHQQPADSGNWVTDFQVYQFAADEDQLEFAVSVDQSHIIPPQNRLLVGDFEKRYLLLDKQNIVDSLTVAAVSSDELTRSESPKKWWSHGI